MRSWVRVYDSDPVVSVAVRREAAETTRWAEIEVRCGGDSVTITGFDERGDELIDELRREMAHLDTDTQGVPGSTESVADAAEATAPGPAEPVAPDPSQVGSERSDLGNICVAMLAGTLAGLRDRLADDGYGRAAAFVADLADRADAYVAGVAS